ncbi:MAG: Holliday junction branch migration protein RuvA [Bacteroidia bacterium]|nr:Holliday junction branch migration protein RuvA [Bacteroidia bacterium]
MYEYIHGKLVRLTPAFAVIENSGIGYFINITLFTYSQLEGKSECQLYIHQVIREDAQLLYGFSGINERDMFRHLISVSGIGSNTARMMLSSLSCNEIEEAILRSDVNLLKTIKGIGLKTAQRVIIDLKDKLGKASPAGEIFSTIQAGGPREESISALIMLGFSKSTVEKVIDRALSLKSNLSVEELIKTALKQL